MSSHQQINKNLINKNLTKITYCIVNMWFLLVILYKTKTIITKMAQLSKVEFSIKNVKLLKYLLITSGAIAGENTINMLIGNDQISSIQNNNSESCFKKWAINHQDFIYDLVGFDELTDDGIKVSIFRGLDFAKKILSFFDNYDSDSEYVRMIVHFDPLYNIAKTMEIKKYNLKNNHVKIGFRVPTANALTNYVEYEQETIDVLFGNPNNLKSVDLVGGLNMQPNQIKDSKELFKIVTDDELQQNYIAFYYHSNTNQVFLTDETISYELFVSENPTSLGLLTTQKVEVSKDLFSLLDASLEYRVDFKTYRNEFGKENKIVNFTMVGRNDFELVTAFSVLVDVEDDFDFDELTNNNETFG